MTNGNEVPILFTTYESYDKFVSDMMADMWDREQIAVDNTNTSLTTTVTSAAGAGNIAAGGTGSVIEITCPPGRVMSIKGTEQVPQGADRASAHGFWMRLACGTSGVRGQEIDELTHINIQKITPSTAVIPLIKDIYQSVSLCKQHNTHTIVAIPANATAGNLYKGDNEIHRFRKGIIVYGQDRLQIQVVSTSAIATTQIWTCGQREYNLQSAT
jgi:hypothetical protein